MRYEYHEVARAELEASAQWYDQRSAGLAAEFIREVDHAIERVISGPDTFAIYDGQVRQCPLRRFPYHLLYILAESKIEIIAVMHTSRRPGYWRDRLSS